MTFSQCEDYVPDAVAYYVDAKTDEVLHIDEYKKAELFEEVYKLNGKT